MAVDDSFDVPFGEPLLVEALGLLENDTFTDGNGEEVEVTGVSELVTDIF